MRIAVVGGLDLDRDAAADVLVIGRSVLDILHGKVARDGDGWVRFVRDQRAVGRAADGADRLLEVGRFL